MQLKNNISKPLNLRPALSAYIIFFFYLLILFTLSALVFFKNHSVWGPLLIISIVSFLFFIWLSSFQLILTSEMISYKTLFHAIEIPLDEITKIETRIGAFSYVDRFKPTFRLEVHHVKSTKPVMINIKIFPKLGVRLLLEHLGVEDGAPRLIRKKQQREQS